jgi:hypothetical protein
MRRLAPLLAILALAAGTLAAPAVAHAESFNCSIRLEPFCAEDIKKEAEEAAKKAEEQAPATFLDVTVRSHHGSSYSEPGQTRISVTTSPYVVVTMPGAHSNISGFRQLPEGKVETSGGEPVANKEPGESGESMSGTAFFALGWSCHFRGQTIHFTVQAQGGTGPPLVHTGTFKVALSARWCAAAKRREREQASRDTRERQKTEAKERKEAAENAQREREHYEVNCRAIGGTPVEISTSEGNRVVCHSKTGGVIPVPQ